MRPPIVWIVVAFGAGLWAGLAAFAAGGAWYAATLVLAGAAVLWRRAPLGAAIGVVGVAGILWGRAAVLERNATCAGAWGRGAWGVTRAATVRLRDPVGAAGGVVEGDLVGGPCGGRLAIRWLEARPARGGTRWVVAGRWLGGAERGVLVARRLLAVDRESAGRGALRDRIAARADTLFGARAALVQALVIARKTDLEASLRERYARAGLAHLLAISGLHVGFIAAWLLLLLKPVPLSVRVRLAACGVLLMGYLWLLGFPPPATRAVLMLVIHQIARLRQRVVAPAAVLGLAALGVMLADPWAVRSVGAWLSVAAVAGVVWATRAAARMHRLVRLVAPAVAATLATAPITALAFGTVAPIGVLANLVAIPLAGLAVPGLVAALVTAPVFPWLARLLAAGAGLGLELIDLVARLAAAVPGGHVVMIAGPKAALAWLATGVVGLWLWHSPRRPWLLAARVAFAAACVTWTTVLGAVSLDACRCLTVHFLDVGQGDAAALRTPAGRWIVIDGGPRTPGSDAGRRVVIPFLRRHGAGSVAVVVATHGDADHLGGIPAVIAAFPPALVLEPGEPLGRPLYLEFLAEVEASAARYRPARAGDRIELDGVTLEVLSPDSSWLALPLDVNEHGVVVRVTYGDERVLFQADAGLPVEARLAGTVGRVAVLKVGHHGSRSATSDAWIDELAPVAAVISVGARNHYGHPAPEVVERLAARGIHVWRTDRSGTITLRSDGHGDDVRSDHD